eukprot:m.137681 g.137681  ORF g.137681 m.137681 type:complete len:277 (+) comp13149_c0_seq10:527-1357(+)
MVKGWKTPLIVACGEGHLEVVKVLVSAGADVNKIPERGRTAVLEASTYGHFDIVEVLLGNGADLHAKLEGNTVLHYADNADVMRLLLSKGANPNAVNDNGQTPFQRWFGISNALERLKLLVAFGARITEEQCVSLFGKKRTQLEVWRMLGLDEKIPLVSTIEHKDRRSCIDMLEVDATMLSFVDNDGNTPLHIACKAGDFPVVQVLVAYAGKLGVTVRNKRGEKSVDLARTKKITSFLADVENGKVHVEALLAKVKKGGTHGVGRRSRRQRGKYTQ